MKLSRRSFVLGSLLAVAFPKVTIGMQASGKEVTFTCSVRIKERGKARLWIPVPVNTEYQQLKGLSLGGNFERAEVIREKEYGTPILYAEFGKLEGEKSMKATFSVEYRTRRVSLIDGNFQPPKALEPYLKATPHLPTTGKVKELAERITADKRSTLERAYAIYEWVVENTYRDPKVKGCGPGNVNELIEVYEREGRIGGKCADQSSIFVALCRSVGIPAREVFGLRVEPAYVSESLSIKRGSKDLTKAQHCRAEFWAGEWIPVDPADVTKMRLGEKLKEGSKRLEFAKRYLFGNWDPHWVAFNWLRDGNLEPQQELMKPLPFFGYPYAEVNGYVLNYLEPQDFSYSITRV
ncbi:transglutaminase-like putative cysteine protease [Hydrogenivirga caldilitoris]|uniref:Transglutaminase-like putative cysteine protease n=1 Tax=Hydrogenivirga caldilitoris TaxID=246264 RepID=A0A497XPH1_9AQUI|nr:transglutaminase family protein [Hydrogenivirga caldilitoris]RLJ70040.1 transglutaminase-like putative cysteine protease [Hydrogenivirga caldilitoris]